ncbi:Glycine cleavage system transcriptional activator [Pigmentiphaga humi]|uniref:Glycine cleavage system transcriptional activator n=1 Tax=Pigmentiphaga humi TaxID=2478468 RepID=A0A3P4B4M4_9BURK|nr:LysR family transcriptional regulator [Pigmentiphaga humi]VCU71247.1 Glycine cleavage system transcriptional activator [Pigmentiphaga humi]
MRRKLPSTAALAAFEAAARHQSFTKAAAELALTQSAVCRQIAGLESFLGLKLFRRTRRGVTLTQAGQSYGEVVARRLDEVERDTLDLMARRGEGGVLELASVPTFATRWLLPRLASFERAAPNIVLNITPQSRPFLFEGTPFDAALHAGDGPWPGTEAIFLMPEKLVPVCSPKLLGVRKRIMPEQFSAYRLLQQSTRPYAWRQWFDAQHVSHGHDLSGPRYELFSMLIEAAVHGQGIALVPRLMVEDELAQGKLIVACDRPSVRDKNYYLVLPEWKSDHAPVHAFIGWLTAQAAQYCQEHGLDTPAAAAGREDAAAPAPPARRRTRKAAL